MNRVRIPTVLLFVLSAACSAGGGGEDCCVGPPPVAAHPLLLGGDISALGRIEQGGAVFKVGDVATDAIVALRAQGSNTFRLRLFLAPNGDEVQVNNLAYTVALAQRIKASGATFMLDLHYSDTWADPGHQVTPAAWSALGIDALEDTVEAYTSRVLDTLRAHGTLPRIVAVGNEIDGGFLWPLGRMGSPGYDDPTAYARFGRLLRAGVLGVRDVTTAADSVRVMIHYSGGANTAGTQWFYDIVAAQNVGYDMIGLSYYPWWHGTIAALGANLTAAAQRYGKDIMIVETSYPWRAGWSPVGALPGTMSWPATAEGQRLFVRDLLVTVAAVPNQRGVGVLWWYPEAVEVPGLNVWGGGTLALFDANGRVLPAAGTLKNP